MSYLNVITLERAKNFLRIDPTLTEDDVDIETMIKAALAYCEKKTNIITFYRPKTYTGITDIDVYDYPILQIITDPEPFSCTYATFTRFPNITSVTLGVGNTDLALIPDELIECALQILKVWYYESEKQVNTTLIPDSIKMALDSLKRFL